MLVQFGHPHPVDGLVVTEMSITDDVDENDQPLASYAVGTTGDWVRDRVLEVAMGGTAHFGGNTAIADVVESLRAHQAIGTDVNWVHVYCGDRDPAVAADFERCLAEYLRVPQGRPDDVEDTHWTLQGNTSLPPGVHPQED